MKDEKAGRNSATTEEKTRKPYQKPAIRHEIELETRAGSPVTGDPSGVLDLTGTGSDN